jgi:hypothetical protein
MASVALGVAALLGLSLLGPVPAAMSLVSIKVGVAIPSTGGYDVSWPTVPGADTYVIDRGYSAAWGQVLSDAEYADIAKGALRQQVSAATTHVRMPPGPQHNSNDWREQFTVRAFGHGVLVGSGVNLTSCPKAFFVAARGSGQNRDGLSEGSRKWGAGLGSRGLSMYQQMLARLVPGAASLSTAAVRPVPIIDDYWAPAVGPDYVGLDELTGKVTATGNYDNSVRHGISLSVATVLQITKGCPSSKVVMTGYSQGAHVIGDAYARLCPWTNVGCGVDRVVLLADPKYNASTASRAAYDLNRPTRDGSLGPRLPFRGIAGVVVEMCYDNDFVCQRGKLDFHGPIYDCLETRGGFRMATTLAPTYGITAARVAPAGDCRISQLVGRYVQTSRGIVNIQRLDASDGVPRDTAANVARTFRAVKVPTPATYRCLQSRGVPFLSLSDPSLEHYLYTRDVVPLPGGVAYPTLPNTSRNAHCVNQVELRNRVVDSINSSASWFGDASGVLHSIRDVPSFACAVERAAAARPVRTIVYDLDDADIQSAQRGAIAPLCLGPKATRGSVLRLASNQPSSWISYLVDGNGQRRHIPDARTLVCLTAWAHRPVISGLTWTHVRSLPEVAAGISCSPSAALGKIVRQANGAAHFVDHGGVRHAIADSDTWYCLVDRGVSVLQVSDQQVAGITAGASYPSCLSPQRFSGTIIRRADGVSWVVSGGQRHHLPDLSSDVCARAVQQLAVSRKGLSYGQAASIPEASPWVCDLNNKLVKSVDKPAPSPAYVIRGGRRTWISDGWTYDYWARRLPLVLAHADAVVQTLPYAGVETPRLDPAAVPANVVIRRSDGVSWIVGPDKQRHHIPYARDDACWRLLRGYRVAATGLTAGQAGSLGEGTAWPCVVGNRVVKSSDGRSYFVDTANVRHGIPDTETFAALARIYPVVGPWPASEVATFIAGSNMGRRLDPQPLLNSILCRNGDGVCWTVDGAGVRHHIPTYGDNVCWRWVQGWVVRRWADGDQTGSLPEAEARGCSMNNTIVATNEGAAYYMEGNTRRWIQDPYDFGCYAAGRRVIRGMGKSEADGLAPGSTMPLCTGPGYRVVTIYSPANNRYATTEVNYGGADYAMVRAARTTVGSDWERFRLIGDCSNRCLIQSLINRKLVMGQFDYQGYAWGEMRGVSANANGSWEGFRLVGDCNTGCGILALGNGRYVSAELDYTGNGYGMLRARATTVGGWEKFIIR